VNEILLRAEREDYARLVSGRWRRALRTVFICALLAAGILVFDYRLMIFAFIVLMPAIIAVADPVKLKKAADALGNVCAVHWKGELLVFNDTKQLPFSKIRLALSFPDAVVIVTGADVKRPVTFPLPAERGPKQEALLAVLRGRNVTVQEEGYVPVAGFALMGLGMFASILLVAAAGVLTLAGVVYLFAPFINHTPWPDWRAGAYLGGALLAFVVATLLRPLSAAALLLGHKRKNKN